MTGHYWLYHPTIDRTQHIMTAEAKFQMQNVTSATRGKGIEKEQIQPKIALKPETYVRNPSHCSHEPMPTNSVAINSLAGIFEALKLLGNKYRIIVWLAR
eukprot:scaffold1694_cov122-Skeletonema_dohrnii-CCMP3373.AAC.5